MSGRHRSQLPNRNARASELYRSTGDFAAALNQAMSEFDFTETKSGIWPFRSTSVEATRRETPSANPNTSASGFEEGEVLIQNGQTFVVRNGVPVPQ